MGDAGRFLEQLEKSRFTHAANPPVAIIPLSVFARPMNVNLSRIAAKVESVVPTGFIEHHHFVSAEFNPKGWSVAAERQVHSLGAMRQLRI